MRKVLLLVGAAIGFVWGSRAGREPYDRLERAVRDLAQRPEIRRATENVTKSVQEHAKDVAGTVWAKVPYRAGASANRAA
jgi:hypothetical protein